MEQCKGTPIRILHVLGALDRGGAETMIMNLYRNIDRAQIQFDFLIHTKNKCDYTDEIINMGGKIYSVDRFKGYNIISYIKQFFYFYKSHPEHKIIHGHMRSTASIYLYIAKKMGKYTIAHSHSISSGTGIKAIIKNIMQFPIRFISDYNFACSFEAGKWLFGKRIVNSNKFNILNNAVDISKFIFNIEIRENKRKELELTNQFIIGYVARFHHAKNHDFLIDVFWEISKKNENFILILVGEGELKQKIKEKVKQYKIEKQVIFFNSRNDINELMQAFDLFAFPSKYEGLGMVAIEAQCASLPVLCSEYIPREVQITENITFLPLDLNSWIEKILELKMQDRKIVNPDSLFESSYNIDKTTHFLTEFYLNNMKRR